MNCTYITGRDKLVYFIETANGFKKVLRECIDIEPEVHLVHNYLYWAARCREFYSTLGGSQPKRVRFSHSWAGPLAVKVWGGYDE